MNVCGENTFCQITLEHVVPSLGILTCFGIFLSSWGTVGNIVKTQRLGTFNILPQVMLFINCLAWTMYSFLVRNYYVFTPNLFGILFTLFYTLSVYHLADQGKRNVLRNVLLTGLAVVMISSLVCFVSLVSMDSENTLRIKVMGFTAVGALIVFYSSPLSEMKYIIQNKDASSIGLGLAIANGTNGLLWTCYGFAIMDYFILVPNFLGVTTTVVQLGLLFLFGHKTPKDLEEATRVYMCDLESKKSLI